MKYLLCCLLCFVSLSLFAEERAEQARTDYEQLANLVKERTAKEIQEKYGVRPLLKEFVRKRAKQPYKKALSLAFVVKPPVSIDQARRLLVEWSHIYLNNINKTQELQVLLPEFPCTPYNVEISCAVLDPKRKETYENSLFLFTIQDGALQYLAYDEDSVKRLIHLETYGDACEILAIKGDKLKTPYGTKCDLGVDSIYLGPMLEIEKKWEEDLIKDPKTKFIHKSLGDGAFPAYIAVRQGADPYKKSTTFVGIAPIPFFRASLCFRAYNYAICDDSLPLLDVEGTCNCFEGGCLLSGPGPKARKWPIKSDHPLYLSIVKAREAKFTDELNEAKDKK